MAAISETTSIASFNQDIHAISELPVFVKKVAEVLLAQPLFAGRLIITKTVKVVSLANYYDIRIFEIFNNSARKMFEAETAEWHIHPFSEGDLSDTKGKPMRCQGLSLWLYKKDEITSLEENSSSLIDKLEEAYNRILQNLQTGWVSAKIEDNPNIMHEKDPKEFYLFIKKSTFITDESALIRFLAQKFQIEEKISCHDTWLTDSDISFVDKTYLWIRKSTFNEVTDKLGFRLKNPKDESDLHGESKHLQEKCVRG